MVSGDCMADILAKFSLFISSNSVIFETAPQTILSDLLEDKMGILLV